MAGFGDVLRGLGSVLNPQVNQEVEADYARKQAQQQALQQFALGQLVKGVESGAIAPDRLPAPLQGLVGVSPEAQARMEALKNEKGYREALAGLGDNPTEDQIAQTAVKFGKPEVAAAYAKTREDRAARLQQAAELLSMKRDQAERDHEIKLQTAKTAEERAAETARHNRVIEGLQAQNATLGAEFKRLNLNLQQQGLNIQRDKVAQAGNQQVQKQVAQLGAALEKANLPEADAVIAKVEEVLSKAPQVAEYLSGPKSVIPDMALPADITEGKQAFQKLFNITLKNRSGAAVTNQELERLKQEFGAGVFKTPQQLRNAVEQARNIINKHYASIASGFGKDALDAYNENAKAVGARVVLGEQVATQSGSIPPPPPGFTVNK